MRVLLVSEGKHEESGALEALVRRVAPHIESCTWDRASSSRIDTQPCKGQGFSKRAIRWILEARKRGYDALVLVIDEDGRRDRASDLDRAQSEAKQTHDFPCALGVAIRSFDAWMLADEKALSAALGRVVPCQPSPEDNRDPKADCATLLKQSNCGLRQRELYAQVAQRVDLEVLAKRCPQGFGGFAAQLRAL
ncbi:MAG: DUF4276 family protein [Pirellulaceae bacterium]